MPQTILLISFKYYQHVKSTIDITRYYCVIFFTLCKIILLKELRNWCSYPEIFQTKYNSIYPISISGIPTKTTIQP